MAIEIRKSNISPDLGPADLVVDHIRTGLVAYEAIDKACQYSAHVHLPRTIANIILDCQDALNMRANGKGSGCLYREAGLPEVRQKGGELEVCGNAVPVMDLVWQYMTHVQPIEKLILSPVVRIRKTSDRRLQSLDWGEPRHVPGYPLYRYSLADIPIVTHLGRRIDPATWTEDDHWQLVLSTEELASVLRTLGI